MLTAALDAPVIHAFEPAPDQFRWLEQHWKRPNIHLHPLALGSQNSRMEMNLYDLPVLNSLLPLQGTTAGMLPHVSQVGSTTVQTATLDSLFESLNIEHVDLLKVDTQGYDFEVLKGSARLFSERRISHVLIELNHASLYTGQCSPWEIESFLASHGFRLVDMYEKVRTKTAIDWCTALFQNVAD
jgi:FkbM family methyltransferase